MIPFLGIALFIIMFLSAAPIGKMLNNTEIVPVLRALGVIFVFSCFARVPVAILERNMEFKKLSLVDFYGALVFSIFALVFAFRNLGIWSLVWAYIIKTFVSMVMILAYARWKPRLEFNQKIAWEMFGFGKFIFLSTAIGFLRNNLDNFLVGKLLGVTMLGYYAVSFNIANFGFDYFGRKIDRVTYPAYSKLLDKPEVLKAAFFKTFKYTALFAIPLGVGIFLLGKEFLLFAYGDKWLGATGALRILAWIAIFNTLPVSMRAIFLAKNRPDLNLWYFVTPVVLFLVFIAPVANLYSVAGVGAVVSISSFIVFLLSLSWVQKLLAIRFYEILTQLKSSLLSTLVMAICIIALKNFSVNILLMIFCGVIAYVFSLFIMEREIFIELATAINFKAFVKKKVGLAHD
jgi:PST family polysaccharide transporter/lipopolysaccharide exporter